MPLFNSRPQAQTNDLDEVLQTISMGECDEHTIRQLQEFVINMSDDDVRSLADVLMTNLVKYPDSIEVLTGSVKALEILPFMPKAKNEFIITLLLSLLKTPINKKDALQRKTLKSEIIKFLLYFVSEDDQYAKLMMSELIAALDDTHGTISSSAFRVLQRLAVEKPDYFEHYSAALIKQLGSINKYTRAESAKLIGIIAKTRPEYVTKALPFLQSLASFYPDANVKRNANEAYQIIWRSMKIDSPAAPATTWNVEIDAGSKGFADIVKLNADAPSAAVPDAQFTDDELKDIIEMTRKEFKSDAESILNSLGIGHLNVKGKEGRPRQKAQPPKAVAAEPEARTPLKIKKPTISAKSMASGKHLMAEKRDLPHPSPAHSGIASSIKRDQKESPGIKHAPGRAYMPKCPGCGGSTWAEGQLCDACAGAEFDRKAVHGHT